MSRTVDGNSGASLRRLSLFLYFETTVHGVDYYLTGLDLPGTFVGFSIGRALEQAAKHF